MIVPEALKIPYDHIDRSAKIHALLGPSGVGKSTLARALYAVGLIDVTPTLSTRLPDRHGETQTALDRILMTEGEFDEWRRGGHLLDEKVLYGNLYGIPFIKEPQAGRAPLIILKPVFMPKFLKHYPNTSVYLINAPQDVLPLRMQERGQSQQDIDKRMQEFDVEMVEGLCYANYTIDNSGTIEQAVQQLTQQMHLESQPAETQNQTL